MSPRLGYVIYPIISVVTWASNIVVGRRIVAYYGIDGITLGFLRFLIATPLLALFLAYKGQLAKPSPRMIIVLFLAGLFGIAGFNSLLYMSLGYITGGTASFLAMMVIPITYVLSVLAGKERATPSGVAGVALGLAGVYIILSESIALENLTGTLLALAAAASWSIYTMILSSWRDPGLDDANTLLYTMAWGTLALAPIADPGAASKALEPVVAALILYVAVVPGILGYLTWNIGVSKLGPFIPSMFIAAIPALTVIMESMLLGESITARTLAGGALVIASIIVVTYARFKGGPAAKAGS